MDAIDKSILIELINNCRVSYRELAQKFSISYNAIKKRIKKLEKLGIIYRYQVRLSLAMTGANLLFGLLLTDGSQDEEEFVNQIGEHPQIVAAASYTGGHYALIAEYRNSWELLELTSFLRSFKCVNNIETHQILRPRGSTMTLSKLHIRVLNPLIDDPRMSIADIAKTTGLPARRIRKVINELVDRKVVQFTILHEKAEAYGIPFLIRITWDEKLVDYQRLINWLNEKFPLSLLETYISADSAILICFFAGENLNEVDAISRMTRRYEPVQTVKVLIAKHHKYFPGIRDHVLNSLIKEAEL